MKVWLRKWSIGTRTRLEFDLDDQARDALLALFDNELLVPVQRQSALLYLLGAGSDKPHDAAALSSLVDAVIDLKAPRG